MPATNFKRWFGIGSDIKAGKPNIDALLVKPDKTGVFNHIARLLIKKVQENRGVIWVCSTALFIRGKMLACFHVIKDSISRWNTRVRVGNIESNTIRRTEGLNHIARSLIKKVQENRGVIWVCSTALFIRRKILALLHVIKDNISTWKIRFKVDNIESNAICRWNVAYEKIHSKEVQAFLLENGNNAIVTRFYVAIKQLEEFLLKFKRIVITEHVLKGTVVREYVNMFHGDINLHKILLNLYPVLLEITLEKAKNYNRTTDNTMFVTKAAVFAEELNILTLDLEKAYSFNHVDSIYITQTAMTTHMAVFTHTHGKALPSQQALISDTASQFMLLFRAYKTNTRPFLIKDGWAPLSVNLACIIKIWNGIWKEPQCLSEPLSLSVLPDPVFEDINRKSRVKCGSSNEFLGKILLAKIHELDLCNVYKKATPDDGENYENSFELLLWETFSFELKKAVQDTHDSYINFKNEMTPAWMSFLVEGTLRDRAFCDTFVKTKRFSS